MARARAAGSPLLQTPLPLPYDLRRQGRACTMARARAAGSPLSKIRLPLPYDRHRQGRACTMARARAAGSPLLKMPLPTNTPSMPICIISAASAGVATPPAAKFTTGKRPSIFVCGRQTCSTLQQHTSNRRNRHTHDTARHQWKTTNNEIPNIHNRLINQRSSTTMATPLSQHRPYNLDRLL